MSHFHSFACALMFAGCLVATGCGSSSQSGAQPLVLNGAPMADNATDSNAQGGAAPVDGALDTAGASLGAARPSTAQYGLTFAGGPVGGFNGTYFSNQLPAGLQQVGVRGNMLLAVTQTGKTAGAETLNLRLTGNLAAGQSFAAPNALQLVYIRLGDTPSGSLQARAVGGDAVLTAFNGNSATVQFRNVTMSSAATSFLLNGTASYTF